MISKEEILLVVKDLSLAEAQLYLLSDGSGTTVDKACGFACASYFVDKQEVSIHRGGFSHGTNNLAELIPAIHALYYNLYKYGLVHKRTVEIVSDSEVICKQGNKEYARNSNTCFWAAIDYFEKTGYSLHWNHVSRNSNTISAACDKLAGETRIALDNCVRSDYDVLSD